MADIFAITSHVVFGHVGGQAAILPLQRMGHEVWHLPTVLFSNHPAYGGYGGRAIAADRLAEVVEGLRDRGFLGRANAVLSGYLGTPETADLVAHAVDEMRGERADLVFCCDPVIGDAGRIYVAEGLLEAFRDKLIPLADVATPNCFELGLLAGRVLETIDDVIDAAESLRRAGCGAVVCTSAVVTDDRLTNVLIADEGNYAVDVPCTAEAPHGTGDFFSAVLLGHYLKSDSLPDALAFASAAIRTVVEAGANDSSPELALIGAQSSFLEPRDIPVLRRLG